MFQTIDRIRTHVYPRRREANRLQASDVLLGMLMVMLAVLVVAYALTLAAGT